jgi:signal peptidase I
MALWSVLSFLFISNFVISTITISGLSMEPTLSPGQVYLLNRWSHRFFPLNYGDLVVVRDHSHNDLVVKRVIALPTDTIAFHHGTVLLNGEPIHEPYLHDNTRTYSRRFSQYPLTLGSEEYFLMGDNRLVSDDSRSHGPFYRKDVLGTISSVP